MLSQCYKFTVEGTETRITTARWSISLAANDATRMLRRLMRHGYVAANQSLGAFDMVRQDNRLVSVANAMARH